MKSIIDEIIEADCERLMECGHEHAITQWPLSHKEWDALKQELKGTRHLPRFEDDKTEIEICSHTGSKIRVFRYP